MKVTEKTKVGEIVAGNYKSAKVFQKYNIDFCCKGGKSLEEVCEQKHLPANKLIDELISIMSVSDTPNTNFQSFPLDLLADYIEKKHHRYVNSAIPAITQYLDKVCKVHGDKQPELYEINRLFKESSGALTMHMKKEELILFPVIRKLVEGKIENNSEVYNLLHTIGSPIEAMKNEHEIEGERFSQIATLSNGYTPPDWACNTYKVAFALLKEFEEDLHLHIHLENNILFPKALELETSHILPKN